jgi:amidase
MMQHEEYAAQDATGLAELIRSKEVTAQEVEAAARARAAAVNPIINAIVLDIDPPPASRQDGPFAGVPFLLKDMDGRLAGYPCSYGSRSLADWIPESDSEHVKRYREAGLRIIGKTNCPEFGILGITEPELHGPTRNPWHTDHVPGGSSGGSAAAVAAGIVPAASAGDGGGSIRIPASACGLFGFKPSRGLTPLGPEGDPWMGLVSRHVLTRSVRDSAAILDATSHPAGGARHASPARPKSYAGALARAPRKLTIGISRKSFLGEPLHPDCLAAVEDAAALLESLGHRLVEFDLPIDETEVARAYLTIVAAAVASDVAGTKAKTGRDPKPGMFERPTWFLKQVGEALSARELYDANEVAAKVARSLGHVFGPSFDVHLSATMAAPPVKVGELGIGTAEKAALSVLQRVPTPNVVLRQALNQLAHDSLEKTPNTQVFNMTGQPAMNLPLYWNEAGLPIGVQIAGAFGADELLLRLAQQVHDARPWFHRRPQLGG